MKCIKVNLLDESQCNIFLDHIVSISQRYDGDDKEEGCTVRLNGGHTILTSQNFKTIENWIEKASKS